MSKRDIKFAQHYVECTQCESNAEYYCNTCTDNLCQVCRDRHTKSKATRSHVIVIYQGQQETSHATETCHVHPELGYEMVCRECQLPVCIRCIKEDHKGHTFKNIDDALGDFEVHYKDKIEKIKKKISKWRDRLAKLSDDKDNSKQIVSEIRTQMREEAKKIKMFVDKILEKNLEELDTEERGIIDDFENEISFVTGFISSYDTLVDDDQRGPYRKLMMQKEILQFDVEPDQSAPQIPCFQSEMIVEDDITKLFGKLSVRRNLTVEKQKLKVQKQIVEKNYRIGSPKKCNGFKSPLYKSRHISLMPSDKFWIGDEDGCMMLTDKNGNIVDEIKTNGNLLYGFHTVSKDGDLLFIDNADKSIKKYSSDGRTNTVIILVPDVSISVYSSQRNGDILVGMYMNSTARIVRYDKEGCELWQSQYDGKCRDLYDYPKYITENVNGDICTSDGGNNKAVVVVDKDGNHRFSYYGLPNSSYFSPYGICTDIQGHVLVIDSLTNVHMIDQNGTFIMILLTKSDHGIIGAYGLCSDADNNLCVCEKYTVKEYKYLYS